MNMLMRCSSMPAPAAVPACAGRGSGRVRWLEGGDLAGWDAFVAGHPGGWLCHLSGWKRALERTFPHIRGRVAALVDEATGAITAGLPVYHVKSSLTGSRLVCAPFATLFDPLASSPDQVTALVQALRDLRQATGSARIEIRTLQAAPLFQAPGFARSVAYKLHSLDLRRTPGELMAAFSRSNVRQGIARAGKAGLSVSAASTPEDVKTFYRLYVASRQHLGLPALPLQFFLALWHEFAASGGAMFLVAARGGQPVAALLGLRFRERFSVDYLGWDRGCKAVSPSAFILWEAIQRARGLGCAVFDFGRTSIHNESLLAFKRHWGARETDLVEFYYRTSHGAPAEQEGTWKHGLFKRIAPKTPDRLYRLLSRFCYRHLG